MPQAQRLAPADISHSALSTRALNELRTFVPADAEIGPTVTL